MQRSVYGISVLVQLFDDEQRLDSHHRTRDAMHAISCHAAAQGHHSAASFSASPSGRRDGPDTAADS